MATVVNVNMPNNTTAPAPYLPYVPCIPTAPAAPAAPTLKPIPTVGPRSCSVICPNCRQQVRTRVAWESTSKTHWIALAMCFTFLWPCAVCLYCTPCTRNVNHYCPACKVLVNTYER